MRVEKDVYIIIFKKMEEKILIWATGGASAMRDSGACVVCIKEVG